LALCDHAGRIEFDDMIARHADRVDGMDAGVLPGGGKAHVFRLYQRQEMCAMNQRMADQKVTEDMIENADDRMQRHSEDREILGHRIRAVTAILGSSASDVTVSILATSDISEADLDAAALSEADRLMADIERRLTVEEALVEKLLERNGLTG
jgi:hypothetical protein